MSIVVPELKYSSVLSSGLCSLYKVASPLVTQDSAASGLEALFYRSAEIVSDRVDDLTHLICRIAVENFSVFQLIFSGVNVYVSVLSIQEAVEYIGSPTLIAVGSYIRYGGVALVIIFGVYFS